MTYRVPRRDRIVSRLISLVFRFASEEYRSYAKAVEHLGRKGLMDATEQLLASTETSASVEA